jgi:hypothetical protein
MGCYTVNADPVVQGDKWAWSATFNNDDDSPYDLSIYDEIQMQIRKKSGSEVIASGTLTGGEFAIAGEDQNILSLENVDIPSDVKGVYQFDIEFIAEDVHETLIRGTLPIVEQITDFT